MIRAVLIDLSGTLHIEDTAISGAVNALKKLKGANLFIKFVTNTTKESQRILHERLVKLGFDLSSNEIFSSLQAAKSVITKRNLKPFLLIAPEALEDFEGLNFQIEDKPNAVVVGLAPSEFHYEKLNDAFRCLLNGASLIAIHAGKYYKRKDGLAIGPGFFVKGFEYSAQCKSEIIGKPNESFFLSALGDIKPHEAVMVGDDVTDDVEGAMKAGLKAILVRTGKYQKNDENKINPPPTRTVSSFVEAVDIILECNEKKVDL